MSAIIGRRGRKPIARPGNLAQRDMRTKKNIVVLIVEKRVASSGVDKP
jgi:hypothetical protein